MSIRTSATLRTTSQIACVQSTFAVYIEFARPPVVGVVYVRLVHALWQVQALPQLHAELFVTRYLTK